MKIKEVITKTGLTDRAIRLYIENDLVKPEYDENYNGRKSIDFSENDVEKLKNIALLRKADFSIQEIKALQMGGETAQNTIKEYINRTNEKIEFSNEIIERIGTLANEENITINTIANKPQKIFFVFWFIFFTSLMLSLQQIIKDLLCRIFKIFL